MWKPDSQAERFVVPWALAGFLASNAGSGGIRMVAGDTGMLLS